MLKKAKRILEIIAGSICLAVGLTGFLLPFLPGWPAFILGVVLISPTHGKKLIAFLKISYKKLKRTAFFSKLFKK